MSTVSRQDSIDSLASYDSFDFDSYVSGDLLEAPTLSSKEIERAREQALKVLETESPEEAKKRIFSEGSEKIKSDKPLREKVMEAAATKPPKAADGNKPVGVMQPQRRTDAFL